MSENFYNKQADRIKYYENKIAELRSLHKHYVNGYSPYCINKVAQLEKSIRHYEGKLRGMANNKSINSDNPDAIDLLELKLEKKKERHAKVKSYNAKVREYASKGEKTDLSGYSENEIKHIKAGVTMPAYELAYLTRDIREISKKIERLKKLASDKTQEKDFGKFKIVDNVEENRVQIILDEETGRELYKTFKSYGFVFSRINGAYQRKRGNAKWATEQMIKILQEHYDKVA